MFNIKFNDVFMKIFLKKVRDNTLHATKSNPKRSLDSYVYINQILYKKAIKLVCALITVTFMLSDHNTQSQICPL